jgi:hypothetical protein
MHSVEDYIECKFEPLFLFYHVQFSLFPFKLIEPIEPEKTSDPDDSFGDFMQGPTSEASDNKKVRYYTRTFPSVKPLGLTKCNCFLGGFLIDVQQ